MIADPFDVLSSTQRVTNTARHVRIDDGAIGRFVASFGEVPPAPPPWDDTLHWHDADPARTAGWMLALDALNFCFWSQGATRWQVTWHGVTHNGYRALAAAMSRAVEEGARPWDAAWLRDLAQSDVAHMLRGDDGGPVIPLPELRWRHLVELGEGLGEATAANLLRAADGSAVALIGEVLRRFPSFRDVAIGPDGMPVTFLKRAQILVADLAGALAGDPLGAFRDLEVLTAFADYKVPQVMRHLGILVYEAGLAETIAVRRLLPAGCREELEIRAATVQACERIRLAFAACGIGLGSHKIDWMLWSAGQSLSGDSAPYHRTLTPFY